MAFLEKCIFWFLNVNGRVICEISICIPLYWNLINDGKTESIKLIQNYSKLRQLGSSINDVMVLGVGVNDLVTTAKKKIVNGGGSQKLSKIMLRHINGRPLTTFFHFLFQISVGLSEPICTTEQYSVHRIRRVHGRRSSHGISQIRVSVGIISDLSNHQYR